MVWVVAAVFRTLKDFPSGVGPPEKGSGIKVTGCAFSADSQGQEDTVDHILMGSRTGVPDGRLGTVPRTIPQKSLCSLRFGHDFHHVVFPIVFSLLGLLLVFDMKKCRLRSTSQMLCARALEPDRIFDLRPDPARLKCWKDLALLSFVWWNSFVSMTLRCFGNGVKKKAVGLTHRFEMLVFRFDAVARRVAAFPLIYPESSAPCWPVPVGILKPCWGSMQCLV